MPEPHVQRQVEEEELIQAKSGGDATPAVTHDLESQIDAIRGGGKPLSESERTFFELRFGVNFGQVSVHTGTQAAESAQVLNARAYTLGQDVIFGAGEYAPETGVGRQLLAHELVHVIQQQKGSIESDIPVNRSPEPTLFRYPRSYARARLPTVGAGAYPHLRVRGLDVDSDIAPRLDLALATHDRGRGDVTRQTGDGWICAITETSSGANVRDMRILYIDDDGRTFRREWRVENDAVTERPQPAIQDAYQLLSEPAHELAGERARELTSLDPGQLADAFDMNSAGGWHLSLPASPDTLRTRPGRRATRIRERVEPQVTGRGSGMVHSANPAFSRMVARLVQQRLAQVEIPTASGALRLFATPRMRELHPGYYPGYVQGVSTDLPQGAAVDYRAFWAQVSGTRTVEQVREVGVELRNPAELAMWRRYLSIAGGEGDVAAVNTYDNQLLTIGAGFSSQYGEVAQIYERMPDAFHEELYQHGIYVDRNRHELEVLDTERGAVVRGINARRILRTNQRLLGVLIRAAMSAQPMSRAMASGGSESASARVWMLRAQFEQFRWRNRDVPPAVWEWPRNGLRFAFLLRNWGSAIQWRGRDGMVSTQGDGRRLAVLAYERLRQLGSWRGQEELLWLRISRLATRSGFSRGVVGLQP